MSQITAELAKDIFQECEAFEKSGTCSMDSRLRMMAGILFPNISAIHVTHLLLTTKEVYKVLAQEYMKQGPQCDYRI